MPAAVGASVSDPSERSGRDSGSGGGGDAGPGGDVDRGGDDRENAVDHGGRPCPRCGEAMVHRHCKYVCPIHGVVYDCSDTFY